ncbi:helix-turn-helix domain-containing protein [Cryobacterium shii]|nr:helix-turn-helix domain-containing protein [Cryobacterium shii]
MILAWREKGESIWVIARVLDVSVGTVHTVLTEETAKAEALAS